MHLRIFFFFLVVDLLYVWVCVSVMRKTTLNLLIPQLVGRTPSERNSRSSVCTMYDSSCLFVFYLICQVLSFLFFLTLSLSILLWLHLKSCTVLLSRSELLQNCSAIRNCEFLNKTFFVVFHLVFGFIVGGFIYDHIAIIWFKIN